jgi:4-oxalocrotonate tautomerase family enzyme
MPIITVEMMAQDTEKKAEIAEVFTNELSRITGVPKDPVVVLFHDLTKETVATAGVLMAKRSKKQ